jgi:hypothetical protein
LLQHQNSLFMPNRFQPVDFKNIEAFLAYLPVAELEVVEALRELVLECIPGGIERLAYNVPFYYRHSRICFIWPGSVPWGTVKSGVQLGFCQGALLPHAGYLEAGNRQLVYVKTFATAREINAPRLRQLIEEAVLVDEEKQAKQKGR